MSVEVRPLSDADLPAILALLGPTEARSTFLVGNATECGVADRGGRRNGLWLGAFEGGRLRGVLAHARGPNSLVPACEGHAGPLVAEAARRGVRPGIVVGTADRVAEVVAAAPPTWRVASRNRETLMALSWARYAPPPATRVPASIVPLPAALAAEGGALLDMLSREARLPHTSAENVERARRSAESGSMVAALVDGHAVSLSSEAAATGRLVHVGATVSDPAHRRLGLAGACVAAVLRGARAAGRASEGAVLFTGEDNAAAKALYASLGFVEDVPFELCVVDPVDPVVHVDPPDPRA